MNIRVIFVTVTIFPCFALISNGEAQSCMLKGAFLKGMDKVLIAERHVFLSEYRRLCQMFETGKWHVKRPFCFVYNDTKLQFWTMIPLRHVTE